MKKRTRRMLFWLAVVIFIVASWVAIRYAQGYAYDFATGTFVRTGAVAMTVNTGATLLIDDVQTANTSFLGNRVGEEGLLPGTYDVRLYREGFTSWRKSVLIEEGRLVDFPYVLLLATDDESILKLKLEASRSLVSALTLKDAKRTVASPSLKPKMTPSPSPLRVQQGAFELEGTTLFDVSTASKSILAEQVLGFGLAEDASRILWWTRNEIWVLWLRNTHSQPYRSEGERQTITRFSVPIVEAAWFRDVEHIVVDLGNQSYRVIETDTRGGTNIIKI